MDQDPTSGTSRLRSEPVTPGGDPDALELHFVVRVANSQASLRATKAQMHEVMTQWHIDDRTANAVRDVAHELLTNALHHGQPPVELALHAGTLHLRLLVSDAAKSPARMLPYRPGVSEHGLGLRLVQQLSSEWGQQARRDGKTVWALFHRPPAT
jgi:two-component sensor histidine kinase